MKKQELQTLLMGGVFRMRLIRRDGTIEDWDNPFHNLVVNEGLQHILDILFTGISETQIDPWYVALLAADPVPALADTMASHAGWTEFENYDEAARQAFVDVRSSQTVSNSASKASFTISTDSSSIGGAALVSNSTKGGATGILLCAAARAAGNKAADDGDTLEVQYDFTTQNTTT